jgi:hypothetical protein
MKTKLRVPAVALMTGAALGCANSRCYAILNLSNVTSFAESYGASGAAYDAPVRVSLCSVGVILRRYEFDFDLTPERSRGAV